MFEKMPVASFYQRHGRIDSSMLGMWLNSLATPVKQLRPIHVVSDELVSVLGSVVKGV
jgi:hypothetical protein